MKISNETTLKALNELGPIDGIFSEFSVPSVAVVLPFKSV